MTYIQHTGEAFISPASSEVVGETDKRFWVGVTPRLAIRDGDGGYARLTTGSTFEERVWVAAYLAPFTLRLPFYVDVQVRFPDPWPSFPTAAAVILGIDSPTSGGPYVAGDADETRFGFSVGPWHDVTFEIFPRDEAELAAAAAAGHVFIAVATVLNSDEGYDVSFLGLRTGDIPLRLRQRGDGLGMGGPRLFGRGSRQRSPRARGYL